MSFGPTGEGEALLTQNGTSFASDAHRIRAVTSIAPDSGRSSATPARIIVAAVNGF
jgi:hypothetical protein